MMEQRWRAAQASVRGKAHIDSNLPNQDSVTLLAAAGEEAWVAVVSDGAGTAIRAADGSREATADIAADLLQFAEANLYHAPKLVEFSTAVELSIERLRTHLQDSGWPLHDFHCTFVACVAFSHSVFVAYLGDSVALASRFDFAHRKTGRSVDFFPAASTWLYQSRPSEYSNETRFLTESDWRNNLRVDVLPPDTDAVILMTDGAREVAMSGSQVFRGFLSNLVAALARTDSREERDATIRAWLEDKRTYTITGDDKTLVALLSGRRLSSALLPVYMGEEHESEAHLPTQALTPARTDASVPEPEAQEGWTPDAMATDVAHAVPEEDCLEMQTNNRGARTHLFGILVGAAVVAGMVAWIVRTDPQTEPRKPFRSDSQERASLSRLTTTRMTAGADGAAAQPAAIEERYQATATSPAQAAAASSAASVASSTPVVIAPVESKLDSKTSTARFVVSYELPTPLLVRVEAPRQAGVAMGFGGNPCFPQARLDAGNPSCEIEVVAYGALTGKKQDVRVRRASGGAVPDGSVQLEVELTEAQAEHGPAHRNSGDKK